MAQVSLKDLTKKYDDVVAVNNVNLEIKDQEFVVLVGPSGCGKTTTLRMVAGLEEITKGEIHIGEQLVNNLPSKDRNIAMVFQSYALYPHMNVFDNMAFGLKMRKVPKENHKTLVYEAADILGIRELLDRKPKQLSGGQRQRVALGRAIVRKPDVFLFDEPLSNLDAKLRVQMRTELIQLHNRLKSTSLYVTHDQVEAMTMGDRIVVLNNGFIQQVGSPLELYNTPVNLFVASFIGSPAMNFLDCRVTENGGIHSIQSSGFKVLLPKDLSGKIKTSNAKNFVMGIRPEDISKKGTGEQFARKSEPFSAQVNIIETLGKETYLDISVADDRMMAVISPNIEIGLKEMIGFEMNLDKFHLFNKDTGEAIF